MSTDGFIDDASSERLVLSDQADWAEVHALRETCDAVLVGAETVRRDNPSFRDMPVKIVVSGSGSVPSDARIFGSGEVIIFTTAATQSPTPPNCTVITLPEITARKICEELERRGISRLLVEGGARTMRMFSEEDCLDEFRLAIAPITIHNGVKLGIRNYELGINSSFSILNSQFSIHAIRRVGRMLVSEYILHPDNDLIYLQEAINLSRRTPPSKTAYSVGAVIVTTNGEKFTGYTHQTDPANHAEEEAIAAALKAGANLAGATIYCSLEPCSRRHSKPVSCTQHIIEHRFARVVYAAAEPDCFVCCEGAQQLREAGIAVRHIPALADRVLTINQHILKPS